MSTKTPLYAEERQRAIAEIVARRRRVSVSEAAHEFGVTTETVRRDLAQLESAGLIRRVHGGAVPLDAHTSYEPDVAERDTVATASKAVIARAALRYLPAAGGSVILDAGTTTRRIAAILPDDKDLTVVTNAPLIAVEVTGNPRISLQMIGGRVRASSQAAVGPAAVQALSAMRADVAFMGTNGLSLTFGLSTPDADEAVAKAAMIAAARRVVVVADSRKVGEESLNRFATLDQVDIVITDSGVPARVVEQLEEQEIDVVIA